MFTVENLREFLIQASGDIAQAKEELTRLDAQAGDGDLGVNMEAGFQAVADQFEKERPETLQKAFLMAAMTINSVSPSTLGTMISVVFKSFSKDCEERKEIDSEYFSVMLKNAAKKMMNLGGAKPGDKTILDSLCPYMDFVAEHEHDGRILWREAAQKAKEAADATAQLVPSVGRARMYGEKAKGIRDGGAVLFSVHAKSLADYLVK